ncbi:MAG: outer membrane protein beta-barrel domain [Rickettsiaceae bacterium]|jgi:opacity protein-like surface antigen|nr:outer membrane protein beta-barrel domain [Rickettsiaceae bacterium]
MKKLILITAILTIYSCKSYAAEVENPFYIGAGYQINDINYDSGNFIRGWLVGTYDGKDYLKNKLDNYNLFAGYQITKNIALELGYFQKNDAKKINNDTGVTWNFGSNPPVRTASKSSLRMINLDAVGNIALDSNERFKLLGILGLSHISHKYKINEFDDTSLVESKARNQRGFGIDVGTGIEADIIKDRASLRATAKYIASDIDIIDGIMAYNVGLKLNF